jgi:HupE / UreJ protein
LKIVAFPSEVIEFLIPVTILITAIGRVWWFGNQRETTVWILFGQTFFFGLIHGLGFSYYFSFLMEGMEESIVMPLTWFTLGIEFGQIMIVVVLLGINYAAIKLLNLPEEKWNIFLAGLVSGVALLLMKETAFWISQN